MVHIVQCLCPERHCIMATAYETDDLFGLTPAEMERDLKRRVEARIEINALNPWCGICGSRTFSYEDIATKYKTISEALPQIRATEKAQAEARLYLQRF